ncbi:unnamed protein product [Heterobilharzia americana]|nr:unnamed protein product [Heterobilharzia americana]
MYTPINLGFDMRLSDSVITRSKMKLHTILLSGSHFRIGQLSFYPSLVPLYAVVHALFWLPVGYFIAIAYDHVQPIVPYTSALGIYPPEKYMFMALMGSYGVLTIISQWLWCFMMRKKFKRKSWSTVGQHLCVLSAITFTVSGICIVILSFINMKSDNRTHYNLTLLNFICHTIGIPLSTLLVAYVFRPWVWFCLARVLVSLQMIIGSYSFVYFNKAGLRVLDAEDFYYIKSHEPGYKEIALSAFSEWFVIFGCVELTLITGLELRKYEKQYADKD